MERPPVARLSAVSHRYGDVAALDGIDLSLPVTLGLAGVLYLLLLNLFPEPAGVYGPQGPRWVRCKSTARTPVTTAEMA